MSECEAAAKAVFYMGMFVGSAVAGLLWGLVWVCAALDKEQP